jgi:hypothetical protein
MSQMNPSATRYTMPVGQALSLGLKASLKNLIPFGAMALLIYVPWIALTVVYLNAYKAPASRSGRDDPPDGGALLLLLATILLPLVLNIIVQAPVTYGVVQQLRGKRAGFGECLSRGFASLGRVFGTLLLALLRIIIGYCLLIVPGIIETFRLAVVVPAAIAERAGPRTAVRRSIELTKGSRGAFFGVQFVIGIVSGLLTALVGFVTKDMGVVAVNVGNVVVTLWSAVWSASCYAAGYYLLRKGKENLGIEELAQVFA